MDDDDDEEEENGDDDDDLDGGDLLTVVGEENASTTTAASVADDSASRAMNNAGLGMIGDTILLMRSGGSNGRVLRYEQQILLTNRRLPARVSTD
jgi:hypothetical protein